MRTPPLCDLYVLDENNEVRAATSSDEWRLSLKRNPLMVTQALGNRVEVRTFFTGVNKDPIPAGPPLVFRTIILGRDRPERYDATYRDALKSHVRTLRGIGQCVDYVEAYVETYGGQRERRPARASRRVRGLRLLRSNE